MRITEVRPGLSVPLRTPFRTALRSMGGVEDAIVELCANVGAADCRRRS